MSKRDSDVLDTTQSDNEVPVKLYKSGDNDSDEDIFNSGRSLENLLLLEGARSEVSSASYN